ncbi:hypothetical protein E6P97_00440 [Patescibacteria group bacterium]|nr:MAG: hypothetical protein E6P97_00440 [Patescibacteria group bacterium]
MGVSPKNQKQANRTVFVLNWAAAAAWLLVAYLLGSKALDSGSWWHYGLTLIAVCLFVRAIRIVVMYRHGKH